MDSGILGHKWNGKTAGYVLLFCLPVFVLQLCVILIGPQLRKDEATLMRLPLYFTSTATSTTQSSAVVALFLSEPERLLFEALAFTAFLALLCCAGVCICMLVYFPVADSLALGNLSDLEARRRVSEEHNESISLIANQSYPEESSRISPDSNSDTSTKRGSISFRAYGKDGASTGTFVELSLFSPSRDATPPGSPPLLGWPMRAPPALAQGPP
ncbi:unnamed protein product [Linum tenue]|uniref:Uncharacterized protein n=1 Tax=Linum tenue TaxID=586396 RepID=A0AAV0H0X0_9ROSI|nr:unnamed protein product [Linum tenue]CAI0378574.1 unnamed protein product [Linum tenue]